MDDRKLTAAMLVLQVAPTGERAAIEKSVKLLETTAKTVRCDGASVSECRHCNAVYLARVMRKLLDATAPSS